MPLNQELAALFARMASLVEIKGESSFKAIAFSKVGRILDALSADVRDLIREGKLGEIEGIGSSSRKIIEEYARTGQSTDHDELAGSVPSGLVELLAIPSLGPKTIGLLWQERDITNLEQLVQAIDSGGLAGLKGIGEKKIASIKAGIALRSQAGTRKGIVEAMPIAEALLEQLRGLANVKQAEIAGSLRRRRETIGDVDLVCALDDFAHSQAVAEAFTRFTEVQRVLGSGTTKASVVTIGGLQVDLRIVPADSFGAALLYFTGSKDHNVKIRGRAQTMGMTLNEWGLYDAEKFEQSPRKTGDAPTLKPAAGKTEQDIYKKLKLDYIEPELRENRGEVEAAESKSLPQLITLADIRGDLHTHTTASDGANTIEEMAEAAMALGYEFYGIADHSKSQVIANGLSRERLLKHIKEIHRIGDKLKGIKLLAGCEVDILADGHLDFEDEVLAELDYVVASPHVALRQDQTKATDRLLRAIENRYVTIIGHPTGRLIDRREGLPLDFPKIFKAAAAAGTALEINASYPRLDLNDIHARAAIAAGVKLSINTDAHSTGELANMQLGINVARRAWATKGDVINCVDPKQLLKLIDSK